MAEGWARHLRADRFQPFSAGLRAKGLDPRAVAAMAEAGIDIRAQTSDRIADLQGQEFDTVVTVCDRAAVSCPTFPARTAMLHAGFDDPPALARDAADEEQALAHYRRVRDEIREFVLSLD